MNIESMYYSNISNIILNCDQGKPEAVAVDINCTHVYVVVNQENQLHLLKTPGFMFPSRRHGGPLLASNRTCYQLRREQQKRETNKWLKRFKWVDLPGRLAGIISQCCMTIVYECKKKKKEKKYIIHKPWFEPVQDKDYILCGIQIVMFNADYQNPRYQSTFWGGWGFILKIVVK